MTQSTSARVHRPSSNAKQGGQWVKSSAPLCPGGLIYKDFLPALDPDRSTCCTKQYATFSETVQRANEWLGRHEGCEVVACESVPFSGSKHTPTYVADSWPTTTCLRGLRVWVRGPLDEENSIPRPRSNSRVLLSYRDFTPRFDGKSMFTSDYEDVNVLLERVNAYLADRTSAAKVFSLQTLDTPMDGLLDVEADTERSKLAFPQHGFTRYCRSLRVFSVTKYKRGPTLAPLSQPTVAIKDFTPNDSSSSNERICDIVQRAMKWCSAHGVSLLNLQVLSLRAGEKETTSSTWLLESPGHIPNKFTSFVRIAYVLPTGTSSLPEPSPQGKNNRSVDTNDVALANEIQNVESVPGAIMTTEKILNAEAFDAIHCKIFAPRLISSGNWCGGAEWEDLDQTVGRLNSWVSASQGALLTLHTQYIYYSGSEIDVEATRWERYMSSGRQVGVLHAIVEGGRPPTALPARHASRKSKCSIM